MDMTDAARELVDVLIDTLDAYAKEHNMDTEDVMCSVITFYCGVLCMVAELSINDDSFPPELARAWAAGVFKDILDDTVRLCTEVWEMVGDAEDDDDEEEEDL